MKYQGLSLAFGAAALSMALAAPAAANPVGVQSYSMINGASGFLNYQDNSYTGTGAGTDYAALSGGTGDLTDGVIATDPWYVNATPFVGWAMTPTITFNFDATYTLTNVHFYFANDPEDGILAPSSISFSTSGGGVLAAISPTITLLPGLNAGYEYDFSFIGLETADLTAVINFTGTWVMASEVQFNGNRAEAGPRGNVPEPASWAMMLAGFGLIGYGMRRRSALRSVSLTA